VESGQYSYYTFPTKYVEEQQIFGNRLSLHGVSVILPNLKIKLFLQIKSFFKEDLKDYLFLTESLPS
jgi:hypothetical protein